MDSTPKSAAVLEAMPGDQAEPAPDIAGLTRRLVKGEEAAYRGFFALYFNRLLGYLLVLSHGREEVAREALQRTLLRLVRHIKDFDSEPVFWSWLTVLARSSLVDEQRRESRYSAFLERFSLFHHQRPGAGDPGNEDRLLKLLEARVATLSIEERKLVASKYLERHSVEEIAREEQTTAKAVESRLTRLRRKLKALVLADLKYEREP